jgi:hypothetical protein
MKKHTAVGTAIQTSDVKGFWRLQEKLGRETIRKAYPCNADGATAMGKCRNQVNILLIQFKVMV